MSNRNYTTREKRIIETFKKVTPHICYYCGLDMRYGKNRKKVTVDHKRPLDRGGETIYSNLVIACNDCNEDKDNLLEIEYINVIKERERKKQKRREELNREKMKQEIREERLKRKEKREWEEHQKELEKRYYKEDHKLETYKNDSKYINPNKIKINNKLHKLNQLFDKI
ncbi:MAG: HNH endonuclease [archaeon]